MSWGAAIDEWADKNLTVAFAAQTQSAIADAKQTRASRIACIGLGNPSGRRVRPCGRPIRVCRKRRAPRPIRRLGASRAAEAMASGSPRAIAIEIQSQLEYREFRRLSMIGNHGIRLWSRNDQFSSRQWRDSSGKLLSHVTFAPTSVVVARLLSSGKTPFVWRGVPPPGQTNPRLDWSTNLFQFCRQCGVIRLCGRHGKIHARRSFGRLAQSA